MGATFTRVENINDKVHDLSLTITQWRVLFAVNDSTSLETIKELIEDGENEILAATAKLVESGLITQEGEAPQTSAVEATPEPVVEPEPIIEEPTPEPEPILEEITPEPEPVAEEPAPEPEIEEDLSDSDIDMGDLDLENDDTFEIESVGEEEVAPEPEPVVEEATPEPEPVAEETAPVADAPSGGKIYVIDDSIVIRKMAELALEDTGIEVIGYSSGKDAIDNMSNDNPSLAIIDVGLPDISGVDIMKKIKATLNIPVLLFSNKNSPADEDALKAEGADGFVTKPFRDDDLVKAVKENM